MKSCSVKRLLGLVLVLACILAVTAVPVVSVNAAATYVAGDANGDGSVNSKDVVRLLYHVLYPTDSGYALSCEGDVNGDGMINAQDALATVNAWLRKGESLTQHQLLTANVNGDTHVNTYDVLGIVEAFVYQNKEYAVVTKATKNFGK